MVTPDWFVTRTRNPPYDPVNLVFYGKASSAHVSRLLRRRLRPRWHRYGLGRWVADLALGASLWGQRRHIRVYDCLPGDEDPAGQPLGTWSVATAHLEHFDLRRRTHLIDSWNEPREYLKAALAALGPGYVGKITDADHGAAGWYHGRWFDGVVTFIELV